MQYLKKLDLIQVLLILMTLRSLFEINFPQAFVTIGIFSIFIYQKWLVTQSKPDVSEELKKEISSLRDQMGGVMLKNSVKTTSTSNETRRLF